MSHLLPQINLRLKLLFSVIRPTTSKVCHTTEVIAGIPVKSDTIRLLALFNET